ncbi:MAG: IS4 family transposase [Deltaproteobacteria bacterium]|nr:IS4 family transposase [Deltaproteobacteria bacterium]
MKASDFTRHRVLSGQVVVVLMLSGHQVSMQNALNKCFRVLGHVWRVVTASAYSQARQKVQPEVFGHLNQVACAEYYTRYGADQEVALWHGQRVLGVDGSYLNLPDTAETRQRFSVQTNQHSGGEQVQALASVLYDLRNDLGLSAALGPKQAEKNLLFAHHLEALQAGDVLVGDRAYADYSVMATVVARQCHFVIRFPRQSFAAVTAFWTAPEQEQVVTLAVTSKARAHGATHHLPTTLPVRVVKVVLATGEVEVVGTDLLDAQTYPAAEFKVVYGWRWGHETYHDRIKNIFELERFSGSSVRAIEQDFYGVIFLATLESILSKPAQAQLTAQGDARGCAHPPKVNRAVSYVAVLDHVVELLCDPRRTARETLAAIEHLLLTTPTRYRTGRHFARKKRSAAHRLRFATYGKRVLA